MKKTAIILLSILVAGMFIACNQDVTVDAQVYANMEVGTFVLNGKNYDTLQAAVDAIGSKAAGDNVIYLTRHASGPGAKIASKDVTIDFQGYTYSFTNVNGLQGQDVAGKDFGLSITSGSDVVLKGMEKIDLNDKATTDLTMVYVEGKETKLAIESAPKMVVEPDQYVFWAANGASLTIGGKDASESATVTGKVAATGTSLQMPTVTVQGATNISGAVEATSANIKMDDSAKVTGAIEVSNTQVIVDGDSKIEASLKATDSANVTINSKDNVITTLDKTSNSTVTITETIKVEEVSSESEDSTIVIAGDGNVQVVDEAGTQQKDMEDRTTEKDAVAVIGKTLYTSLVSALDAALDGQTIKLLKNTETGSSYTITHPFYVKTKGLTLDLNEKSLTVTNNFSFVIEADDVTVKNGKVTSGPNSAKDSKINSYVLVVNNCKNVVLDGLTLKGGVSAGGSTGETPNCGAALNMVMKNCAVEGGDYYAICSQNDSNVTIESGTYSETTVTTTNKGVLQANFKGTDGPAGYITVTGGVFTGTIKEGNENLILLKGGTYNVDPTAYVAEGYVATKTDANLWVVKSASDLFPEGSGTEDDPFVVGSADDFLNIDILSDSMKTGTPFYFKLNGDVDLSDKSFSTDYVVKYFAGGLDGKKGENETYKIYAPNDSDVESLFDCIWDSEFSNIEIVLEDQSVSLANRIWAGDVFVFDNVDFSSTDFGGKVYALEHNGSLYFSYNYRYGGSRWGGNYTVKNCDVKLNLKGASSSNSAVFVGGYAYNYDNDSLITVSDCSYEGSFTGNYVALVLSNGQSYGSYIPVEISNLTNKGTLIGINGAYAVGGQNHYTDNPYSEMYDTIQNSTGGTYSILTVPVNASVDGNDKVVITDKSKDYTYTVSLYAGREIYDHDGNQWASNYNYAINFGSSDNVYRYKFVDYDTAIAKEYITAADCSGEWLPTNCEFPGDGGYQLIDKGTDKYYILKFTTDDNLYSKFVVDLQIPTVMVCAYDSSNNLVGLKEF